LPEYDHDRDAPKFEAGQFPGITIYGSEALADFIERSLSNCFHIGTTTQMPIGAAEYYIQKFRLGSAKTTLSLEERALHWSVGIDRSSHGLPRLLGTAAADQAQSA
jgi:hypothetical protein